MLRSSAGPWRGSRALALARASAQRSCAPLGLALLVEGAAERQQRVLTLVDDGGVEGPQRRGQRRSAQADEQLRDGGPADREVNAGQRAPQLEPEGERGLQLSGEAQREADGADARGAQARRERARDVGVERVALGRGVVRDLLGRPVEGANGVR